MSIYNQIIKWAKTLPKWKSDIVRRLLIKQELTSEDEEEILMLIKIENGLIKVKSTDIKSIPVIEDNNAPKSETSKKTVLRKLYNVKHVNKLKEGETLEFAENGLTVIYGNNASGKTGYSRILKHACGARDIEEILPNVYEKYDPKTRAEATFEISTNDAVQPLIYWQGEEFANHDLNNISVFDARCARVYIEPKEKKMDYQPYGADIFGKIVDLFTKLSSQLEAEKRDLQDLNFFESVPDNNTIKQFINTIDKDTKKQDINNFKCNNTTETTQLKKLETGKKERELKDPQKLKTESIGKKQRAEGLLKEIKSIKHILKNKNLDAIRTKLNELLIAQEAAKKASKEEFNIEPLDGIGSKAWEKMFEAAKEYSTKVAYPGKEFPYLEDDSRCVFCLQPLSDEVVKMRLEKFNQFIKNKTAQDQKNRQTELDQIVKELTTPDYDYLIKHQDVNKEIEIEDSKLAINIIDYFKKAKSTQKEIIGFLINKKWKTLTMPLPFISLRELYGIVKTFETKSKEYESMIDPDKLIREEELYWELKSREIFKKNKHKILEQIDIIQFNKKIDKCISHLNTKSITETKKSLMQESTIKELRIFLQEELNELRVVSFKTQLDQIGSKGDVYFAISLDGMKYTEGVNPLNVLSEGEQRALAIASFLAELKTGNNESGIIFDDPVSSLDHEWREKITNRIIKESKSRQVIILTHNIAFLLELLDAAKLHEVETKTQSITSWAGESGIVAKDDKEPWDALDVHSQIKNLEKMKDEAKKITLDDTSSQEDYNSLVKKIYTKLRSSWERAIEQILLGDTVKRYRKNIKTQKLKTVEVLSDDCNKIEEATGKCSNITDAHDSSPEATASIPRPNEIKDDISKLIKFVKTIEQRRSNQGD